MPQSKHTEKCEGVTGKAFRSLIIITCLVAFKSVIEDYKLS